MTQSAIDVTVERERGASTTNPPGQVPIAVPDRLKRPWEYRSSWAPTERRSSHEKFKYYLSIEGDRTLTAVANHFKANLPAISVTAKKNNWITRAAAYDEAEALRNAEDERDKRHNEHMAKLEAFRNRSEKVGEAMIAAAAQLLQQANATIQDMKAQGDVLDRKLLSSALQASARVAESGRLLMAQSLGVDALLGGLDDPGEEPEDRYS